MSLAEISSNINCIYVLTYSMEQTTSQLVKKFPIFYGTSRFITAFTIAPTCSYPEPDRSSRCPKSHFLNLHLNIILPSMSGSSKWSLSFTFPYQVPYAPLLSPYVLHTPPILFFSLDHPEISDKEYRWLSSSLCSFLHPLVTSSLLGSNISILRYTHTHTHTYIYIYKPFI
jgi:hypothetical protein